MTETITTPPPSLYHRRVSLNKRPPLVRSSSPSSSIQNIQRKASLSNLSTKTNKPKKSVRFCDNASLENVRLFLKTQMPKACRSDPTCSKQSYTYRLKKTNWPTSNSSKQRNAVRLEDIQLTNNQLIGTCQVANLAFEKHVLVRYSLDEWSTYKEVDAIYQEPIANSANTWDRFRFKLANISLNTKHHETLYLAVKYSVSGREFWDNNDNKNYQLDILPQVQLYQDEFSSSSSSEEDDEENTFEDCEQEEEEEDLLIQQLEPLSLSTTIEKPWSPPLSPTAPADSNPLWMPVATSRLYPTSKTHTSTGPTEYFNSKGHQNFHHLINKYCPYNNNFSVTTNSSFYHHRPSPPHSTSRS